MDLPAEQPRAGRSVDIARRDIAIYSHEGLSYDHAD
jgi:hypothetical protein